MLLYVQPIPIAALGNCLAIQMFILGFQTLPTLVSTVIVQNLNLKSGIAEQFPI